MPGTFNIGQSGAKVIQDSKHPLIDSYRVLKIFLNLLPLKELTPDIERTPNTYESRECYRKINNITFIYMIYLIK